MGDMADRMMKGRIESDMKIIQGKDLATCTETEIHDNTYMLEKVNQMLIKEHQRIEILTLKKQILEANISFLHKRQIFSCPHGTNILDFDECNDIYGLTLTLNEISDLKRRLNALESKTLVIPDIVISSNYRS